MIALFSILFSLSAALIVACLFGIRKLDRQYIFSLRMTLISAFMITLCQIAIINTSNERVASFSYSVFFIFIDILLLSVFDFSRKYSKYRVRLPWFNWALLLTYIISICHLPTFLCFHKLYQLFHIILSYVITQL